MKAKQRGLNRAEGGELHVKLDNERGGVEKVLACRREFYQTWDSERKGGTEIGMLNVSGQSREICWVVLLSWCEARSQRSGELRLQNRERSLTIPRIGRKNQVYGIVPEKSAKSSLEEENKTAFTIL